MSASETFQFQAETTRVLDLVIHSLYTHKEIFLRELISNASDATDRLRFESLTRPGLVNEGEAAEIRLDADRQARTLTVHDTGIGMGHDELIANLGTIAKSGTRELVQAAQKGGAAPAAVELIGQFGVGFYSVFMVADRVEVVTRRAGEEQAWKWESAGDGSFTVSPAARLGHGTSVTLHLKPVDEEGGILDFADPRVLQRLVKKYSDFVTCPVVTRMERPEPGRDADGQVVEGPSRTVVEDVTLNSMRPLWARPAGEITAEEHHEFYRHLTHDWTDPLKAVTARAEGIMEYQGLLYIPGRAPLPFEAGPGQTGLQLYSKRVLIMEHCEALLPPWLRFVRGVVDSADLPLNVSREMLQHDRHIAAMRRFLTKKVVEALAAMSTQEPEGYLKVWDLFGRFLKEGAASDADHREALVRLLRFPSSRSATELTSLPDYLLRMKPDQKEIVYLAGDSRKIVESSPHLEAYLARGWEVLYLLDPVDELVVEWVRELEGHSLRSAGKGVMPDTAEAKPDEARQAIEEGLKPLLGYLQAQLAEQVKEVRLSRRLTTSPACLVGGEQDLSPQLERILHATGAEVPVQKRILELNPDHEIVRRLAERYRTQPAAPELAEAAQVLVGYALVAEGSPLPDPAGFARALAALLARSL
ncbi:MAG TPA: molecular chaperone HtpG [Thermoanaerobaculaceae bacterium]|nr:molecular chaperone HtpG [Thermoanaerobaculaceae bacterium]HPS77974.1 molecular chaperone HtpG [Thermoanaerobaculaceae bacterium]